MTASMVSKARAIPEARVSIPPEDLRHESERLWQMANEPGEGELGSFFARDTKWVDPLSDQEILALEGLFGFSLPIPYVLFLRTLHSTSPDQIHIYQEKGRRCISGRPGFVSWKRDSSFALQQLNLARLGIEHDLTNNGCWPSAWGQAPSDDGAKLSTFQELFATAPKLVPLYGHRFLVVLDNLELSPVLSIWGTDIIVYGTNLINYLRNECFGMALDDAPTDLPEIPFWEDLL